jgi:hypothetical protein
LLCALWFNKQEEERSGTLSCWQDIILVPLSADCLKHAACLAEIFQVSCFGVPGYLVQPANRGRFETSLRRAVFRINNLDLHLHRIATALDPAFARFTSFLHDLLGKIDSD